MFILEKDSGSGPEWDSKFWTPYETDQAFFVCIPGKVEQSGYHHFVLVIIGMICLLLEKDSGSGPEW